MKGCGGSESMGAVSVIMPCYNHARYLSEAVSSILCQTYGHLELLIVDDCSSDDSWQVACGLAARDCRVKLIRHKTNSGLSKSRNDAMQASKGALIAFCDSDDVWEPRKLDVQVRLLQRNPAYDVTYCDTIIIDEAGQATGELFSRWRPPPETASGWLFRELVQRNFINIQSVLMRRECMQHVGLFDEGIEWVQDWYYWIRLSRHCQFLYSTDACARYRVHSLSTNRVHEREYCVNRFRVFRRILEEYKDLSPATKSDVLFRMATELCDMKKYRAGRRLLLQAAASSARSVKSIPTCYMALRRLVVPRVVCRLIENKCPQNRGVNSTRSDGRN